MPLSVLHVIHSMDPQSGGPAQSLRSLVKAQIAMGLSVSLLTTDVQSERSRLSRPAYRRNLEEEFNTSPVTLHVVEGYGKSGVLRRFYFSPHLRKTINSLPPFHIAHIHGLYSHVTIAAARFCFAHHVPYIIRPAGGWNQRCRGLRSSILKSCIDRSVEFPNADAATMIHATSKREEASIRQLQFKAPVAICEHGTDIPTNTTIDRDRQSILFLSRLHRKKRPRLLLESFARFASHRSDLCLVFAGADEGELAPLRDRVSELSLDDQVSFPGHVDASKREALLSEALFLALPSIDENFGLVLIEAMATGCPVLSTSGVDSSHHVRKARSGVITELREEDFERGFQQMLEANLPELGRRARLYAKVHLSWGTKARHLNRLYENAIGETS